MSQPPIPDDDDEDDDEDTLIIDSSQQWTISIHDKDTSQSHAPYYQALAATSNQLVSAECADWTDNATKFTVIPAGVSGYYVIINTKIGKALTTNDSNPLNNLEWCYTADDHQLWKLIDYNGTGLVYIQNKAFETVQGECGGLLCWLSNPNPDQGPPHSRGYVIVDGDTDAKSRKEDLGDLIKFNLAVFDNDQKALTNGSMVFHLDKVQSQVLDPIYPSQAIKQDFIDGDVWSADVIIEDKLSFFFKLNIPNGTIFQCDLPFISSYKNNQYTFKCGANGSRYWGQPITQQFEATYESTTRINNIRVKLRRCRLTVPYTLTFLQLPDRDTVDLETKGILSGIFYYDLSCEPVPEYYGYFTKLNGDATMIVNENGMTISTIQNSYPPQNCPAKNVSAEFNYSWNSKLWGDNKINMHYDSDQNKWIREPNSDPQQMSWPRNDEFGRGPIDYYGYFTRQFYNNPATNPDTMIVNEHGMYISASGHSVQQCLTVSSTFTYSWPWCTDQQMRYNSITNEWIEDTGEQRSHWTRDPGSSRPISANIIINAIKNDEKEEKQNNYDPDIKYKDKKNVEVEVKDDEKLDEFIPYPVFKRPKDDNNDISVSDLIESYQGRNYALEKQNNDLYLQLEYRKAKGDPWIFASFPLGYIVRKSKSGKFKPKVNINKPYRWRTKKPGKKIRRYTIKDNRSNEGRITASLKKHVGWRNGQTYDAKTFLYVDLKCDLKCGDLTSDVWTKIPL